MFLIPSQIRHKNINLLIMDGYSGDTLEEVEIKIEYNESFERDPLSNKSVTLFQELANIPSTSISQNVTCDNNQHLNQTSFDYHNLSECSYDEHVAENDVTWYETIDNAGRFLCKFCELKYSTLQTLRYHIKVKHPEKAKEIKELYFKSKRKKKLKCHICKQRFKEELSLKSHLQKTHSLDDIKTSCMFCDATFKTESETVEHLYIQHQKVRKKSLYLCNICGYRTSIKSHYYQHKNTHLQDKTNKCKYCDYATNYSPNLKIHERIHTNEKVYSCDYINCQYRCTAKSALRSHQLKHYPEQNELYCDKCSYKTIYKQSLKRHADCHNRNSVRLKLC